MKNCECINKNDNGLSPVRSNSPKRLVNVFGVCDLEVSSGNS